MKRKGRRAFNLAIASIGMSAAGLLGSVALAVSGSGCDTGDAASPQNLANRDSGLGTTTTDSGTTDGSADAPDGSVQDTGIVEGGGDGGLNGCATFTDHTGDTVVDLTWNTSNFQMQANKCSLIAVGSSMRFIGNFMAHPLEPKGGDTPTPISTPDYDAGFGVVTFTTPGLYGFDCFNHQSIMYGAVAVVDPSADAGGD